MVLLSVVLAKLVCEVGVHSMTGTPHYAILTAKRPELSFVAYGVALECQPDKDLDTVYNMYPN